MSSGLLNAHNPIAVVKLPVGSFAMVEKKSGRKLRGLHDLQQQLFYPTYSYERATEGPVKVIYHAPTARTFDVGGKAPRRKRRGGIGRGISVDNAITACVKKNVEPRSDQRGAKAFFLSCRRHNMRPVSAQLSVGDSSLFLGTRADVVCVKFDKKSGLEEPGVYLMEVKTGFGKYLYKHTGDRMKAPLQDFTDSPNNQHHLQLALTKHMFQRTFPNIVVKDCFVVYINDTTVCWVKLNSRIDALRVDIVNAIRASAPVRKEKNKKQFKSLKHRLAVLGAAMKKRRKTIGVRTKGVKAGRTKKVKKVKKVKTKA